MAIILRSSKSVALTFDEMDGNFTDLNNRTIALENSYVKTINGVSRTETFISLQEQISRQIVF